jgi:hypothetical protein
MSIHVTAGNHHTYRANEHDTVLSEVSTVHCILLPRAFLVAGFNDEGRVVMARYNSYTVEYGEWEPSFFEHEFINEHLLGVPQQVKALFVGGVPELLVPNALYDPFASRDWLNSLHHITHNDMVESYALDSADAEYVYAVPHAIEKLLHRYFGETPIIPLAAYQFHKPDAGVPYLAQCLVTQDIVIATLHQAGKLQWHQQFPYSTVEDIAWQLAYLCRELGIPRIDLQIQCTMICDTCFDIATELERFFPRTKWSLAPGSASDPWSPVIYLLQQLYACAL